MREGDWDLVYSSSLGHISLSWASSSFHDESDIEAIIFQSRSYRSEIPSWKLSLPQTTTDTMDIESFTAQLMSIRRSWLIYINYVSTASIFKLNSLEDSSSSNSLRNRFPDEITIKGLWLAIALIAVYQLFLQPPPPPLNGHSLHTFLWLCCGVILRMLALGHLIGFHHHSIHKRNLVKREAI